MTKRTKSELLEALERLVFAAECRENTVGDPVRLIAAKVEFSAALAQVRAVIDKATKEGEIT